MQLGDVDGDGRLTAFDAQMIAEYRANKRQLSDTQKEAAGDLSVQDVLDTVLTQQADAIAGMITETPPAIDMIIRLNEEAGTSHDYSNGYTAGFAKATIDNENKSIFIAQKGVSKKPTGLEFYHEGQRIDSAAWVVSLDCAYELDGTTNGEMTFYATEDATNGARFQFQHKISDPTFIKRQIWRDGLAIPAEGGSPEQIMEIPCGSQWSGSFLMMFYNKCLYFFYQNEDGKYLMLSSYITDYETCTPQVEVRKYMDVNLTNIETTIDEAEVKALYHQLVEPENPKGEASFLFLSNSNIFVFNTPDTFARLAKEAGYYVQVNAVTKSGGSIAGFNDTSSELYTKMQRELARGGYDAVYFNGLSGDTRTETSKQKAYDAAQILAETIRDAGQTPALYCRPPRHYVDEDGDGVKETDVVISDGKAYDEFYTQMGEDFDMDVCYVVRAYALAYQEDPTVNMWGYDLAHVSPVGAYLNGCVLFCHTFGVSCENVGDDFLDPETAAFLRDIADRVVLEGEMPNW